VVAQARKRVPDALKEVGHTGDAQDHSVCKAFLRFLKPAKRGSELRTWFAGPPYGWPREALDAAMLALANAGQVKVTGADGKPAVTVDLNATQLGTCTFAPETRVISASERIAVRALGLALGLSVPSGEENNYLLTIVDRLAQIAEAAGGEAPAPKPPELKPLIAQWRSRRGALPAARRRCRCRISPGSARRRPCRNPSSSRWPMAMWNCSVASPRCTTCSGRRRCSAV
jgi:hypothetical protein